MNRLRPPIIGSIAMFLVLCSCTKEDQKLWRVGIPYSDTVWVDYVFDAAKPDASVVIVNPYANMMGAHGGGVCNGVASSTWTTKEGGTNCSWHVALRADPQNFQIGGAGRFGDGRFLVLTDPEAKKAPVQIDIPIPGGLTSETKLRKWLDGMRRAGISLANKPRHDNPYQPSSFDDFP